jgi:glycosyltransferase involved in cell wall biosynthesis
MPHTNPRYTADICLVLEGTYPYVRGGVSTWVHQLLEMYPQWKFSLFYLGAQRDPANKPKYVMPPNVVQLVEVYLFDETTKEAGSAKPNPARWRPIYENLRRLGVRAPKGDLHDLHVLRSVLESIGSEANVSFEAFWHHPETWSVVRELYERYAAEDSFLDFYWTLRFLIQPLWRLARAIPQLPVARVYHTACTGYAGLAAALAADRFKSPLILTEHGIYLRERIADICRSRWIPDQRYQYPGLNDPLGTLRRLWIGFFDVAGRMSYAQSSTIISLFEKNARAQERFGANPDRLAVIPNGIRTEALDPLYTLRQERRSAEPDSKVVGFLGRVVSIKDVKTLLRTTARVLSLLPETKFLIAGPADEEPEYYRECLDLAEQLHLGEKVKFLGSQQLADFLPTIDIMILTSFSEGLPFVILEALAAAIPVVSTDVGACSELINGSSEEKPSLGPAGLVAPVGNVEELAAHVIRILSNQELLNTMGEAGMSRVTKYYHEDSIKEQYAELYELHLRPKGKPAAT